MNTEHEKLTRRGSKHARPEERYQQIIAAAIKCFSEHGYANTTIDTIGKHAGLSKGSVYRFFTSKDDLLLSVIDYLESAFETRFTEQAQGKTYLEQLEIFCRVSVEDIISDVDLATMLFQTINLPFIKPRLKNIFCHDLSTITEIIEQGIVNGEFKAEALNTAPMTIIALLNGHFLIAHILNDEQQRWQDKFEASWQVIKQQLIKE